MATPNYNLPTISGNMTADVVRDMNALAEATDSAIKEAIDNVDLSAIDTKISTHLADDVNHIRSAVDTGTANAKIVTLNPAPTVYKDLMGITFKNTAQNTGAVTINVNGLGAKSIVKSNGSALTSGFLKVGSIYTLRYNATTASFILQGEGGGGNAQPSDVLMGKTFTNDTGEFVGTLVKGTSIKSIQRGSYTLNDNRLNYLVTIGSVNLSKSIIRVSFNSSDQNTASSTMIRADFYNNTTINLVRGDWTAGTSVGIWWEVIEFETEVKVTNGLVTIQNFPGVNVTLPAFNLNKVMLFHSYSTDSSVGGLYNLVTGVAPNNTTVSFSRGYIPTSQITIVSYFLVEFP